MRRCLERDVEEAMRVRAFLKAWACLFLRSLVGDCCWRSLGVSGVVALLFLLCFFLCFIFRQEWAVLQLEELCA